MNKNIMIAARQIERQDVAGLLEKGVAVWFIKGLYQQCGYIVLKTDDGIFEALKDIFEYDTCDNGWFVDLKEFESGTEQTYQPGNWRFFKKVWFKHQPVIETENDLYKFFKPELKGNKHS